MRGISSFVEKRPLHGSDLNYYKKFKIEDCVKKAKYWYLIKYIECPVCGRVSQYRERQFTPKPSDGAKRVRYVQEYDWCEGERHR